MNLKEMKAVSAAAKQQLKKLDVSVQTIELLICQVFADRLNELYFVEDQVFIEEGLNTAEDWNVWFTFVTTLLASQQKQYQGLYMGILTTTYPSKIISDLVKLTDGWLHDVVRELPQLKEQFTDVDLILIQRFGRVIEIYNHQHDSDRSTFAIAQTEFMSWAKFMKGKIWLEVDDSDHIDPTFVSFSKILASVSQLSERQGAAYALAFESFRKAIDKVRYKMIDSQKK